MTPATCESTPNTTGLTPPALRALPRVLYVVVMDPDQKFGSLEEQICVLAGQFQSENSLFLPLFVSPPGPGKTSQFESRGVAAVCLDLHRFEIQRLGELVSLVREHRIDVVHWNFTAPLGNLYVWGLKVRTPGVRHFFTDHNSRLLPLPAPPGGLTRLVKRFLLRCYSKVVGVSRYVEDCLRQQSIWSNLTHCLHFINTDRFRPDEPTRERMREELGAGGNFVLLTVAQLIPEKGVDVALRALAELPKNVVLWVIGAGPLADDLKELAGKLGLDSRVRFLGLQSRVEPYLQAADCLVSPSLWAEAAGLVNLEAQSCGLPVVASAIGGIPEYVADGETGLLFPPGDHTQLAAKVRHLLEHPASYDQMRARARVDAVARFSAAGRLPDYLNLYRGQISGR